MWLKQWVTGVFCVVVILSFIPMNYIELVPGDDKKVNLLAGTVDELIGLINTLYYCLLSIVIYIYIY